MVVQHDVGDAETTQSARGNQTGIAGSRANQIDDATDGRHCAQCPASQPASFRTSTRMSPAPSASSRSAACRPIALASARVPAGAGADGARAVRSDHHRDQFEIVIRDRHGQRTNRRLTAAAEHRDQLALGLERGAGERIVDRRNRLRHFIVAGSDLDGDDALSRRRDAPFRRQCQRDSRDEAETPQPRRGQHDRMVVAGVQLA